MAGTADAGTIGCMAGAADTGTIDRMAGAADTGTIDRMARAAEAGTIDAGPAHARTVDPPRATGQCARIGASAQGNPQSKP